MKLVSRLSKLEKASAKTASRAPCMVPDSELQKAIAGIALNRDNWMPLETAQRIVSEMPDDLPLEEMSDAQLEAWCVVLDSKF